MSLPWCKEIGVRPIYVQERKLFTYNIDRSVGKVCSFQIALPSLPSPSAMLGFFRHKLGVEYPTLIRGRWGLSFGNVMFDDILLILLGNITFLNNGATLPTKCIRGCSLALKLGRWKRSVFRWE